MAAQRHIRLTAAATALALVMATFAIVPSAYAQNAESRVRLGTDLIVDGSVENVFEGRDEALIQILVHRSDVPRLEVDSGLRYPAPGEYVYVHVDVIQPGSRRERSDAYPARQTRIRAYLRSRGHQWNATGRDWYDSEGVGGRSDGARPGTVRSIGIVSERVVIGRDRGVKVVRVQRDSPAEKAGIEPGDILVKANGQSLTNQDQLNDAFQLSRGPLSVTVRDVRTGRDVVVKVDAGSNGTPAPRVTKKALGVTGQLAFYGGEAAVKVTKVAPNSPADDAGIVAGLLILKANGQPVNSPEKLRAAELESGRNLQLQVVDPKDKRERTVTISL